MVWSAWNRSDWVKETKEFVCQSGQYYFQIRLFIQTCCWTHWVVQGIRSNRTFGADSCKIDFVCWIRFAYNKARRASLFESGQWRFGARNEKQKQWEKYCSDWIAFAEGLQLTLSAIVFGIVLGAVLYLCADRRRLPHMPRPSLPSPGPSVPGCSGMQPDHRRRSRPQI
jgi:hypothetical protein